MPGATNYPNPCYCGHDFTQHSNGAAGAKSGGGGTCLICPDAHTFNGDYNGNTAVTHGLPGRPFYAGNALDSSQI